MTPEETPTSADVIEDAVVSLLNAVVTSTGDCRLCHGEQDEHAPCCPVPALETWLRHR